MKWGGFVTGELVETQKKFTEEQLIKDSIDERYRESYDVEWNR